MASPQAENGHIDIANEIAEALARTNLSAYQSRILWALWRKTWGWHKKEDWISLSQFEEATGVSKSHVSRTVTELKTRNMVTNSGNKISFNKDYTQWRELPKGARGYQFGQQGLPIGATRVTDSGKNVAPFGNHKRNYTKETPTKDILQKKDGIPYQEIIAYLNQKTGKRFTLKPKDTIRHINARWAEGRTLEDFRTVIDNKCTSWLTDAEMGKYLRPETLFGSKFESYLNEIKHPLVGAVSETTRRNMAVMQDWRPPS